jgi:hypothetical protein
MLTFLRLTRECYDGSCPAVDLCMETGEFWVTGYKVDQEHKQCIPETEDQVRVPQQVIFAMISQLLQRAAQTRQAA